MTDSVTGRTTCPYCVFRLWLSVLSGLPPTSRVPCGRCGVVDGYTLVSKVSTLWGSGPVPTEGAPVRRPVTVPPRVSPAGTGEVGVPT